MADASRRQRSALPLAQAGGAGRGHPLGRPALGTRPVPERGVRGHDRRRRRRPCAGRGRHRLRDRRSQAGAPARGRGGVPLRHGPRGARPAARVRAPRPRGPHGAGQDRDLRPRRRADPGPARAGLPGPARGRRDGCGLPRALADHLLAARREHAGLRRGPARDGRAAHRPGRRRDGGPRLEHERSGVLGAAGARARVVRRALRGPAGGHVDAHPPRRGSPRHHRATARYARTGPGCASSARAAECST